MSNTEGGLSAYEEHAIKLFKLGVLSSFGYGLSYIIQENVYGRPNLLATVSEFLGNQTSLTSFFAPMNVAFLGAALLHIIEADAEENSYNIVEKLAEIAQPLLPLLVTITMWVHDVHQMITQPYPDNNVLDMVAAGFAGLVSYNIISDIEDSDINSNDLNTHQ
jgi:hypothetical protein